MTIKNKNVGDKNRKISGKKIMLVTALLSGGVVIRVNNHINNSFGNTSKEVINFDLTLESTDVLIDDKGTFYVGQGTPIDNFNIYDFVTILDESGNVIADKDVTLEWDVKEYFEGTTFGTKGEYLITITATTADGRTGELEYKLVVKEGHIFEEIKEIDEVEIEQTHTKDYIDFQEHFRVLNSATGEETLTNIESTLEDEDLRTLGTKQVIFYTELNGTRFTNSVHISVVDTVAPVIELENSFDDGNGFEWDQTNKTITISELDKAIGDFTLDEYATAYDGSGEYELSWDFEDVMKDKINSIGTETVTITAVDNSGNESTVEMYVTISTVKFEFKDGISEVAFELFHDANINDAIYNPSEFYNVFDAAGNPVAIDKITWNLTEEMIRELGEHRVVIEVLDDKGELIGAKGETVKVQDTLAPEAIINPGVNTTYDIEVNQNMSVDNLFMYLNGISDIDELMSVNENSGVWGYRFVYRTADLTDEGLRTPGTKTIRVEIFDYREDGSKGNSSYLSDTNGNEITLTFNVQDTTDPVVNVVNDVIDLEVVQSATKDMIEITNYAEISDNSGSFSWDLRIKGSQDAVMDYADMLGKVTDPSGIVLELVVTDSEGNVTYSDMLLIVSDTTPPVIEVRKSEETININPSAGDLTAIRNISSYVIVTDNSRNPNVIWDFDTVVNTAVASVYYVTVIAQDDTGNISEETITFTVVDNEAPVIIVNTKTIEIEANEYTNKDELEFDINLKDYITVTDNSNGLIDTTFDYSNVDFGAIGTYEVIITAADAAGNESTNVIQLKVIAGEPKVRVVNDKEIIDNVHIDSSNTISGIKIEVKDGKIVIERSSNPTDQADILAYLTMNNLLEFLTIDGETIESQSWDLSTIDFSTIGTYNIQLTVTNNFGKTATETIEFVVIQEYDSILELKGDNFIDLEIDASDTNRDVAWFESTYDENDYAKFIAAGGSGTFVWDQSTLTNIDFDIVGSYVVTIYLDDGHADRKELTLSLNIIDTTGPVFTTVNDMETAGVNDKDASDYTFADFVTVSDNSGIAPTLSWNLDTQVDFTKVGTYVVTIKAVDSFGNETTKDITFEINDTEAPVLVLNPGMDIQTIEINSRDASSFNINSFVTATDNSGIAPELEWNIQDVDFSTINSYTVEISATDRDMNKSNVVTITFVIEDTIAPTIDIDPVGLEELKIEIDTKTESDYSDWLEDYVTVTDNSNEDITPTWDITSVDFKTVGSYMIVISASDSTGHTTTANVVFAVADTTAPTITLKDNMETTEYEVLSQVGTNLNIDDFVTCDDATNCIMSWDMNSVNFDRVGTYVVTIKAVDMYGNESIQEITLEVQDTTKPEIVITRPDILISMDKHTSSDFDVNDFATVTDNYDTSVSLTWNIDNVEFDKEGTYTVTVSAIDSNGNEAEEKEVTFKVEEVNIVLREVKDFEIEVSQTVDAGAVVIADYFTAEEENGTAVQGIQWNLTDNMLMTYGTHRVTLTIEFDGGKFIDIEVTLEVVDNTDPTVNVDTTTTTIELGDSSTFDNLNPEDFVTVTDNSNDVTYSWDFDNVVEQTIAGTYTVAITVTDVAGNETVVTTEIVVEDTVAPDLVLNDDFDRNNMIWSKSTAELSILASDKAPGEIDLWELVTATDLSTGGLTISWNLADAELDQVGHYTVDIEVSDGTLISTETITVNVLRATPILNDFNVDKSYNDVTVNVDVTNLNEAITSLVITLQELDGTVVDTYTQTLSALDAYTINHVFSAGVTSNTEYKVVLEYKYSLQEDKTTQVETVTDTKDVKTLAYSQNDVLGTISDVYVSHTEIMVNYEINNDLSLMTSALLVLVDEDGNDITSMNHTIDITSETGTHTFTTLTSNTEYKVELRINYDFNDGKVAPVKVGDSRDVETLEYTEHDVIVDITGVTQSPSTISVDYNITDTYDLIVTNGMLAKIYKADDMTTIVDSKAISTLNGTVRFDQSLQANTSYIVIIETSLDLVQDGINTTYEIKETGIQTTTEAYSFDEITVNINNIMVDYDDISFDYEVFDPNGLLVANQAGNKIEVSIGGQVYDLDSLSGNVSIKDSKYLGSVDSGKSYDIQIHFKYDLQDGSGEQIHDTNLYGFVETTRAYDLDQDLTLTSHNLASDMQTIYVDYSLRNLNLIGNMSTLAVTIRNKDTNEFEKILFSNLNGITLGDLEGSFELDSINGNDLTKETDYEITISIDYDLNDGNGVKTNLLLLEDAQIKTKDVALIGYNVISTIDRGYTFLNVDFHIEDDLTNGLNLLDSFKIALLDENNIPVSGYDYISFAATSGDNTIKFENLLSDATYTIVYRIDNPNYTSASGEDEFIDITRKVTTRTYDTNLINVDYTLTQGLTYLHLEDIQILNTNDVFENIDYSSVVLVITYISRDGQLITIERDLGSLTEGDMTSALFTGLQSNTEINVEFKLEYDLKNGEGIQSGSEELIRSSDTKTLEYDFTFTIENDEVLVTGLTPGFTGDHLVIFEEVEGYTVKDIKVDAFYGDNISFSQLTIPRTLETIGQNAFRSVALTKVNLTSVFETIPTGTPRVSVYSTQGVLVIGDNAFRDNAIVGFDFTTTETIGVSSFRSNNLGTILIGDTVNYVGQEAFVDAGVLNLTLGSLLSDGNFGTDSFVGNAINNLTIGNIGFKHSSLGNSGKVFDSVNGYELTFADTAVGEIESNSWRYHITDSRFSKAQITNLTIGSGIESIGVEAFVGNDLTNVIVGDGVHTIEAHAFNTTGISNLTLGNSVRTIGILAFANNNIGAVKFPVALEKVDSMAFQNNVIEDIELLNNVYEVGDRAFQDNNIKTLLVGELLSAENFGVDTFVNNSINDLTIGNIGFRHDSLGFSKEVFDPQGFSLTFADTATGTIGREAWRHYTLHESYLQSPIINLTIGNSIDEIADNAFIGNELIDVKIGDGLHTIGQFAFKETGIQTLQLGINLETVKFGAFMMNDIIAVDLPASLITVEPSAFEDNDIEVVKIKGNVSSVGSAAFKSNNIVELELGELLSDENFGDDTFLNNNISSLTIGNIGFRHDSLGYSGDVFDVANGLDLTFSDTAVGEISNEAWRHVANNANYLQSPIKNLSIGDGITSIGTSAFIGNQLNDVVIGDNVRVIGQYAFKETEIQTLALGDNLEEILFGAFMSNNITNLTIPKNVNSILSSAFIDNKITTLTINSKNLTKDDIASNVFSVNVGDVATITDLYISNAGYLYDTFGDDGRVFSLSGVNVTYLEGADGVIPANAWRSGTGYLTSKVNSLTINSNITTVGNNAFENNNITNLTLPNSMKSVGSASFKDNKITSLTLNDSLEVIGNNAFNGNSLTSLTTNDSLTTIGTDAFSHNKLAGITLNDKLSVIGTNAFNSNELTNVVIPEYVSTIGNYAFANNLITTFNFIDNISVISEGMLDNNKLTNVVLPSNISSVGAFAFRNNDIDTINFNDSMTELNESVFENNSLTVFSISDNITNIGKRAFAGNEIAEITIPTSVSKVGEEAFANNVDESGNALLVKLVIEDGVSAAVFSDGNAFVGNKIEELVVGSTDFKHNTFGLSENVFNTTTGLYLEFTDMATGAIVNNAWEYVAGDSSTSNVQLNGIKIGNSISSIGDFAFSGNILQKVVIGNGVTTVGEQSFASMGINDLTLGDSIQTIGKEAFMDNDIVSFIFPQTLTTIGIGAFKQNNINKLVLPDSVSDVKDNAFENNGMTELTIGASLSDGNFGNNTFTDNSIETLTIGNIGFRHDSLGYSGDVFNTTKGISLVFADTARGVIEKEAWRHVAGNASYMQAPIKELLIGDGVSSIGISAFIGNELNEVVIGDSVQVIGQYAFKETKIQKLTIGENVETIEFGAFTINDITELVIPENVTSIESAAFSGNKITTLTINSTGLTASKIGSNAFSVAAGVAPTITDISISSSDYIFDTLGDKGAVFSSSGFNITYLEGADGAIPNNAWRVSSSYSSEVVNSLTINSNITSIGSNAFENCNLTSLTLSDSVTSLGNNSFNNNNITSLELKDSVTVVGAYAFNNNELTSVTFNDTLSTIGSYAFSNNVITNVLIPENVSTIGASAFATNLITSFGFVNDTTNVTSIYDGTLDSNKITDLVLPNGITSIGSLAFRNNEIVNLELPFSLRTVGVSAFEGNEIVEVFLSDYVTTVSNYAFKDNNISKLTLGKQLSTASFGTDTFVGNVISDLTLGNINFEHDSLGYTGDDVFDYAGFELTIKSTASGTMPNEAWRYLKDNTHYLQAKMTKLTIEDRPQSQSTPAITIGRVAFADNDLSSVKIGNNVIALMDYAFQHAAIVDVEIGSSLTEIGWGAFQGSAMTSVFIPKTITSIRPLAFADSPTLAEVTFESGVVIGKENFPSNPTFYNMAGNVIT